jgi:hypothetical protein
VSANCKAKEAEEMKDSTNPIDQSGRPPKRRRFLVRCLLGLAWLVVLVVLFYVEENWRGARALEIYNRQSAAKGGTLDWKAFVPPPVPDSENFAMTPFLAPLFDFIPGTQQWRDTNAFGATLDFARRLPEMFLEGGGGWRAGKRINFVTGRKDVRKRRQGETAKIDESGTPDRTKTALAILATLAEYGSVIEELRTASRRPQARFNIRYDHDNLQGILLPHLRVIRTACLILSLRSSAELALGQTEQAFNDVTLMLHLVGVLKSEPFLISHLVRQDGLQMTMQKIWEGFADHQWSDAQLQALQERLELVNLFEDLKRSLEAERAGANLSIDQARVSRNLDLAARLNEGPNDDWVGKVAAVYNLCPAGWFYQEQLNFNRMFDESFLTGFDATARTVSPKVCDFNSGKLDEALRNRRALIWEHRVFATFLLPPAHYGTGTIQRLAIVQNSLDEAVIVCALERFRLSKGQYPEGLDALAPQFLNKLPHDIINGEPLKYRRVGDGQFILYSVGWNEVDDGGVTVRYEGSPSKGQDITQGDWVWQFPTK